MLSHSLTWCVVDASVWFLTMVLLPSICTSFCSGHEVRENMFQHFFGKPVENIWELIVPVRIFGQKVIPQTWVVMNKRKITPNISLDDNLLPVLFNLAQKGYTLPHVNTRDGSDMETSDYDDDNDNGNIDEWMTNIWHQFLSNKTMKSWNCKGQLNPSYCCLTYAQRLLVTEDIFCNPYLAVVCCTFWCPTDPCRNASIPLDSTGLWQKGPV